MEAKEGGLSYANNLKRHLVPGNHQKFEVRSKEMKMKSKSYKTYDDVQDLY